jgi:glycosyltransferase involved in cell wall biosynthesis
MNKQQFRTDMGKESLISVVMPVKNEEDSINCVIDIVTLNREIIGEVFIIDDNSSDTTFFKAKELSKTYENVHLYSNSKNLEFNLMIEFLLKKVKTRYVHLRTPHDIFDKQFYKFHLKRLTQHPKAKLSTNNCENLSVNGKTETSGRCLSISTTGLYNRIFDKNYSSCGFVAETEALREAWHDYKHLGQFTDWMAKKKLCIFHPAIHAFVKLSIYNDLRKKTKNTPNLFKTHIIETSKTNVLCTIRDTFLTQKKKYLTYPDHAINMTTALKFFYREISLLFFIKSFVWILVIHIIKKLRRTLGRLFTKIKTNTQ